MAVSSIECNVMPCTELCYGRLLKQLLSALQPKSTADS